MKRKLTTRSVVGAGLCAAMMLTGGVGAAVAGEVTGNGKVISMNGKSLCAFSGLEDWASAGGPAPRRRSRRSGRGAELGPREAPVGADWRCQLRADALWRGGLQRSPLPREVMPDPAHL